MGKQTKSELNPIDIISLSEVQSFSDAASKSGYNYLTVWIESPGQVVLVYTSDDHQDSVKARVKGLTTVQQVNLVSSADKARFGEYRNITGKLRTREELSQLLGLSVRFLARIEAEGYFSAITKGTRNNPGKYDDSAIAAIIEYTTTNNTDKE
jgi:hypothetical protein